jgi:hypothetical protein
MAVPDWLASAISISALLVSSGSLIVSWLAYRRVRAADRIVAWLELARSPRSDWLIATMHVRNPSRVKIQLVKLICEARPDFRLADHEAALVTQPDGTRILPKDFVVKDHYLAMPCSSDSSITVPIDGTISFPFLIYHASFSRRPKVHIGLMYQTMEAKPKFKIIKTVARIRGNI